MSYWKEDGSGNNQNLLGSGWRPLSREFDINYFGGLLINDTEKVFHKSLDLVSDFADVLGRNHYSWWANLVGMFSENMQYEVNEFWDYITPPLNLYDNRDQRILTVETPVKNLSDRDTIAINYALNRLEELILFKVLDLLAEPDLIIQEFADRTYHYPVQQFRGWQKLEILGTVTALWKKEGGVRLVINAAQGGKTYYNLWAKDDISRAIEKASYNLSALVSGYQTRVGKLASTYPISSFPEDIQAFSDAVQEAVFNQNRLAVLVQGVPGTGKTAWTQAIAQEILTPLGYVVFILDHEAVENFMPPNYLEKVCLIINEADNLAQDRSRDTAQNNTKTEHILSLLDGTLYQSVIDESNPYPTQKLVILMTCNTTERLDPAFLRKGRVDLTYEFTHRYV
ncbi:MAG: hypothetical protein N5P05_002600 [Chroococcopsis gigantea SAG 12.99]|jgi:hypothetical protein|nr:AAA family ATPase [Chlorogloea purpurea SAG 13.99]MDV3000994.1 hypothetical protein [Chroococcopsis gigantea SAG 12.99]